MKLVLLDVDRIIIVGCCGLFLPGGGAAATATAAAASARERISRYHSGWECEMVLYTDVCTGHQW